MSEVSKRVAEMSPERRELLLRRLRDKQATAPPKPAPTLPAMVTHREARNEPFPLAPIQRTYWTGRSGLFDLGAVGTNVYTEAELSWATPSRMNANRTNLLLVALNRSLERVVQRHDMLRMVVLPNGQQQILPQAPPYRINVVDLRRSDANTIEEHLEAVRHRMRTAKAPIDRWPLFEIMAHRLPDERLRLHIRLDSLLVDGTSRGLFLRELFRHLGPGPMAPRPPGYRDYVLTWLAFEESELGQAARDYWLNRLPTMPPMVELPLATNLSPETLSLFVKHHRTLLDAETWTRLKTRAARAELTPSGLTTAAFVEVLSAWSGQRRFTLGLIGTYRPPIHKRIAETLGNFNTVYLLEVDDAPGSFEARARRIQQQIAADLEHRYFLGHQVLQELNRRSGGSSRPALPIVFNSVIEYSHASYQTNFGRGAASRLSFEQLDAGLYIPQMLLSPTVSEDNEGALTCSWQSVEQVFPERLMQNMLDSYGRLLDRLANDEASWQEALPSLIPAEQLARRAALMVNTPPPQELLHRLFLAQMYLRPRQNAVIAGERVLSYGELGRRVAQVGRRLRELNARPNTLVAIVMEPGWEQIVAALGVLESGAAYVPIDPTLPGERFRRLLAHSEAAIALTQTALDQRLDWPTQLQRLCLDADEWRGIDDQPIEAVQQSDDLAYVIYTDTAAEPPLAAMIDHRSVVNTLLDINRRYQVGADDRLLALAPLTSDLAIYDMFGTLAAGGTIVVPTERHDPARWAEVMQRERVTIWNSPPALLEHLLAYVADKPDLQPHSLRLTLLSRDWTPITLAERLQALVPGVTVVNQGGATETGIWSSTTAIERLAADATRVPLGAPLTNQRLHVLNASLEPVPDWVAGEIFIGGLGVGKGYWRNAAETRARFFKHPRTDERLFRTGDQGRFLPSGEIELLGRVGEHVTVAGHPVDPRAIEAALERHPALRSAVVRAYPDETGQTHLVAYIVEQPASSTERHKSMTVEAAPGAALATPLALRAYLLTRFPHYLLPRTFVVLDALPLTASGSVDRQALPQPALEQSSADKVIAPRDQLEQRLATIWQEILGTESISVTANFFELGGTSFLAVRLLTLIEQVFGQSVTLANFFEQPTIEQLARVVRETTVEQLAQRLDEQRGTLRQAPVALPKLTKAAPQIETNRAALNGQTGDMSVEVPNTARSMQVFFVIWFGQLVSIIGSGLTGFALGVWVLQRSGSVTEFALISLFAMVPFILVSPVAGVMVDRWDRRKTMIISDTVAALTTLAIVLLYRVDSLSIWMIYLLTMIASTSRAFQMPAYTATTTVLVPREQLGRANGLVQLAQGIGQLISPILAGVLVSWIGLSGVIMVDLATFIFAVITLMSVRIPRPEVSAEGQQARGSVLQESAFGWKYIKQRPGLLGLLLFFAASNFLVGMVVVLANPMVLSFPSGSPAVLGTVLSVAGAGMLVGSIVMSIWGGPRRRVNGVLGAMALAGVCIVLAGLQPSALLLTVTAFFFLFAMPFVGASSQAIWQSKVPADIQGRVFSTRVMIATAATPIAYLIAGPLADYVFQPLLQDANAPLASSVGRIIGYGPGRGIGLMFIVFGLLTLLAVVVGYMYPRLRLVEDELPDAGMEAIDEDEDEIEPAHAAPQPL